MFLKIFRVSGHSMEPYLSEKQIILVSPWLPLRVGDVVVFKSGDEKIVKRIVSKNVNSIKVEGDNKFDSKKFGTLETKDILGKVFFKI